MNGLVHLMTTVNESPFFASGSGPYILAILICNTVVLFILTYIAVFNATHIAEGSRFNKRAMKEAIRDALSEHDEDKS